MIALRASMRAFALAAALLVAAASVATLGAQGNCEYNGTNGSCTLGGNNTYSLRLTVTAATRLQVSTLAIALPTATADEFMTGFGAPTAVTLTMRANRSWSLTLRATSATWTGTGPFARSNRPVADLQRATAEGGPYTNMSTTAFSLFSASPATAGTNLTLYFRARYQWLLDTPGSYSIPLQLTITAP